jgi:hypothetical protein
MEVKNFRIGNLLTSKGWGNVGAIEGIEVTEDGFELKVKGYVHPWDDKYFDLAPIQITDEWLKKLGFVDIGNDDFLIAPPTKRISSFKAGINKHFGKFSWSNMVLNEIEIKYVHELQNLFFALTGEELSIENRK